MEPELICGFAETCLAIGSGWLDLVFRVVVAENATNESELKE